MTVEAIYEDGLLRLAEPVDLAAKSRVRVSIEVPAPDVEASPDLETRRRALPPEKRDLLDRVRQLRDDGPHVDFSIVEALREMREHG